MKPTSGITLPASFVVTVSHAGTEILPTAPADNDILTVAEVAELLKCKTTAPRGSAPNTTQGRANRNWLYAPFSLE
jgi:hypothetical protein